MTDFTTLIQDWYRRSKRELPWRLTNDPYKIWISEVILQQTRVEQGLFYYEKFIFNYPDVKSLANASEDEVLNLWQGLGYYSRARNMHFSAKMILTDFGGVFPKTYKEVRSLKGVGDYTAAAITSIAYNLPHAVVDGNVYRVLSRVYKISEAIDSGAGKKIFAEVAAEILDKKNPGNHNQALMEIGSLVCTPQNPKCNACPINQLCLSGADQTFASYPVKKGKTKITTRHFHYLFVTDGKKTVLKKRSEKDIWIGLYDFRLLESSLPEKDILKEIKSLKPIDVKKDGFFKHVLSHQKIEANFWHVRVKKLVANKGEVLVNIKDLDDYPMPRLLIRYLESSPTHTKD
jgi:A/G-specific adenine glycosylase